MSRREICDVNIVPQTGSVRRIEVVAEHRERLSISEPCCDSERNQMRFRIVSLTDHALGSAPAALKYRNATPVMP